MEEDLADLYENAPCGYLSLSPDLRIVKVNHTLRDWLGRSEDSLLGQPFYSLLSFGGKIAYETHLAPLLRLQGFVNELALDLCHADGSKLPVIANAAEKRGPSGEHIFTRLTLFKAVDRRTYERGLVAARERAEAAAASEREIAVLREQFIAVLGHDLRNPLAAVAAGIRLIGKRESLSETGTMALKEMNASIERATGLIADVLDFARGRLGNGVIVDRQDGQMLEPVIAQVLAEIRAIAPERAIQASLSLANPVDCDPGRIGQLASNLISNALAHGDQDMPIEIEARTDQASFVFSVANSGPAIPPDVRDRLFQPFFRSGDSRNREGLGLGLFIVSEIARAHGGSMKVASNENQTRFTFSMPRKSMAQPRR